MASGEAGVLAPQALIIPTTDRPSTAVDPKGSIQISGSTLIFFDGSAWKAVTAVAD